MNKYLCFGAMLCLPLMASAFTSMTFRSADGEKVLKAEGLTITFADGNLVASDSEGYTLIPLASLNAMELSDNEYTAMDFPGIYTPKGDDGEGGGTTGITSATTSCGEAVTLFTAQGAALGTFPSLSEARPQLAAGLYIMRKADGSVFKTIIR